MMLLENYYTSVMNLVFTGYRIHVQKSVVFLYTNNNISEREIEAIPFTIIPKRMT